MSAVNYAGLYSNATKGGGDAVLHVSSRGGDRASHAERVCGGKNQAGAILERHQLHDDLQCSGGELSNQLPRARSIVFGRYGHDDERDRKH